jgi:alkylation response protein AidB-like acyl-CoA dehydrogenase
MSVFVNDRQALHAILSMEEAFASLQSRWILFICTANLRHCIYSRHSPTVARFRYLTMGKADMPAATPSRTAGYLDAIERLAPLVEEHRASFDRDRRLPDVVFRALAEAGLFRLWLPSAMGGPELSPVEFMQVVEAASAKDGSIGWVVANGGGMSRVAGYLPESIAGEWFTDPYAFIVSATGAVGSAEPVAGGYRVPGRWPFGSGASHATRFMGLAAVSDGSNQSQPPICVYFAREQVTIHDTWHVSGLRGTGSSDFEVKNAFVPAEHTHSFLAPEPSQPGIIYRIPGLTIFPWSITGAPLGIASGAIAAFTKSATQKRIRLGTTTQLQDREMVHSVVGRATAIVGAARAFLKEAMTELLAALGDDRDRLMRARANLRIACAYAAEGSSAIVQMLTTETGASAIFESSALERAGRDINAAVKHVAMSPQSYIVAGRLHLGLDPGAMRF